MVLGWGPNRSPHFFAQPLEFAGLVDTAEDPGGFFHRVDPVSSSSIAAPPAADSFSNSSSIIDLQLASLGLI